MTQTDKAPGGERERVARIIEAELVFCLTSEPDAAVEIDNADHVAGLILSALRTPVAPAVPEDMVMVPRDEIEAAYRWMHQGWEATGRRDDEGSLSADYKAWRERFRDMLRPAPPAMISASQEEG